MAMATLTPVDNGFEQFTSPKLIDNELWRLFKVVEVAYAFSKQRSWALTGRSVNARTQKIASRDIISERNRQRREHGQRFEVLQLFVSSTARNKIKAARANSSRTTRDGCAQQDVGQRVST